MMPRLAAIVGLCLLLCSGVHGAAHDGSDDHIRWYVVKLQEQPAGWMSIERREAGDLVTTTTTMRVAVGRQGSRVVTAFEAEVVEFQDGNVHAMRRTIEGDRSEQTTWRFTGGSVAIEHDGQQSTKPAPQGLYVGPDAERRHLAERIAAGSKTISTQVADPLSGLDPVPTRRTLVGEAVVQLASGPLRATRFETRRGDEDRVVHEWLDDQGHLVRAKTAIGAITQEIILSDEAAARRAIARPPDLIDATRVPASRSIRGHERIRKAVFVLSGSEQTPAINTAFQSAQRETDGSVRITIDLDAPSPPIVLEGDAHSTLLRPTELLEVEDALVGELAQRAVRALPADAGQAAAAEAMRRFVHRYIDRKTLGVALASAAQTARSREGDCTEHATLLAAMLRARGVPARLVAGLIYEPGSPGAEPAFVYHVWTQAAVSGEDGVRWIDLDATQARRPRHAAQIALSISDGSQANDLWAGLAPTLGTIRIDVEATQ